MTITINIEFYNDSFGIEKKNKQRHLPHPQNILLWQKKTVENISNVTRGTERASSFAS